MTPRHAMYVGWIMAQLSNKGLLVRVIKNSEGEPINRLHVDLLKDVCFEVDVPEPDKFWTT